MKIENTIVPLNLVTITHHSSNSHPTMSSTSNSDSVLIHSSSSHRPSSSPSSTNTVVLDLLSTFANSKIPSTYSDNVESTSPVTTTSQQFLFTKTPTTITEENTKLQTFQSVQETVTTTTSVPTTIKKNPSRRPTTTTTKPTKRHRPTAVTSKKPDNVESLSSTKKPARLTTIKSKLTTTTRRPLTTTPSVQLISSKRPPLTTILTKPTRKVTESASIRPLINRNITITTSRPPVTNLQKDPVHKHSTSTTTTTQPFVTISYVETTKVPRPKPKPTKQIVKVPPTSLDHLVELEIPLTTMQSVSSVTTTNAPTTITTTQQSINISTSSTTLTVEMKTESTTYGNRPITSFNESSAENEIKPIIGQTTQKPILVTWSNIQAENNDTNKSNTFNES